MGLAVNLPKKVAIKNTRLVLIHLAMVIVLAGVLVHWKFIAGHAYAFEIGIDTQLELAWDLDTSIQAMEAFFGEDQTSCVHSSSRVRWGHEFMSTSTCADMCTLSGVLTHEQWSSPAPSVEQAVSRTCWSDFKQFGLNQQYTAQQFLESAGRQDLSLITAKNDWMIDHAAQSRVNNIELVPQGRKSVLSFEYVYELSDPPPWFFWSEQNSAAKTGTNQDTRTVIVDAERNPVGDTISPGEPIKLEIDYVWMLAKPFGGGGGAELDIIGLIQGGEILSRVDCFGTDDELKDTLSEAAQEQSWSFGASISHPVCVLHFAMSSKEYTHHVNYATSVDEQTMYATEVVSETTGIHILAKSGRGNGRVSSLNAILLNVTSILVLLALPIHVTSFIATKALGPLSDIYKRVIIEPFDVSEATAATATVVAGSSKVFHQLSTAKGGGKDGSEEVVTLDALVKLLEDVFVARRDTMNPKEIHSLANFCFDAIANRSTQKAHKGGILELIGLDGAGFRRQTVTSDVERKEGVNLDQFNQIRLANEKITFDAVVELFDKDRPQNVFERFFTPDSIRNARMRAMEHHERLRYSRSNIGQMATGSVSFISHLARTVRRSKKSDSNDPQEMSSDEGQAHGEVQQKSEDCDLDPSRQPKGKCATDVEMQIRREPSANPYNSGSTINELRRDFDKLCERLKVAEQYERQRSPTFTGVSQRFPVSPASQLQDTGTVKDMYLRLSSAEFSISKLQKVIGHLQDCILSPEVVQDVVASPHASTFFMRPVTEI